MTTVNKSYPQLEDDLPFLSDITGKLNELICNLQLQGKNKTLTEMVSDVNAFKT